MLFEIIQVGKVKSSWIKSGQAHYVKLLSRYARVELQDVKESEYAHLSVERVKREEGSRLLRRLDTSAYRIALDEHGEELDSRRLAEKIEALKLQCSRMQFLIGGAFGLDADVLAQVDMNLSLSRMTLPHELVAVVLLEQLYRAESINKGSAYHK